MFSDAYADEIEAAIAATVHVLLNIGVPIVNKFVIDWFKKRAILRNVSNLVKFLC